MDCFTYFHKVRKSTRLLICILISSVLRAQTIQHVGQEIGIAYLVHNDSIKSIDFYRGRISALSNTGWTVYDSFPLLPDPMRLLLHPTATVTQTPDTTLIHFTGSGLVYTLRRNGKLERLDRTFYAGYNYGALRYYSGSRLWSIGGSGLWNVQDLAVFYDSELREWERVPMTPEIPYGFTNGVHSEEGPNQLVALVQDGPEPSRPEQRFTAYRINLNEGTYSPIGRAAQRSRGPSTSELNVFGSYGPTNFSYFDGRIYLIDAAQNTVSAGEPLMDVYSTPFNGTHGILLGPTKAYMIQTASTITNVHVKIEKWSYDELLKRLNPSRVGALYESNAVSVFRTNWKAISAVAISAVVLTVLILRYQRNRPSLERSYAQALSPGARMVLRHLLLQAPNSLVSPDELNLIMGIEDKTWDNQRKIRSTVLQELEEKGMQYLGVPSFIERVASEEDRRIRRYRINPQLRDDLIPILKHV